MAGSLEHKNLHTAAGQRTIKVLGKAKRAEDKGPSDQNKGRFAQSTMRAQNKIMMQAKKKEPRVQNKRPTGPNVKY